MPCNDHSADYSKELIKLVVGCIESVLVKTGILVMHRMIRMPGMTK